MRGSEGKKKATVVDTHANFANLTLLLVPLLPFDFVLVAVAAVVAINLARIVALLFTTHVR